MTRRSWIGVAVLVIAAVLAAFVATNLWLGNAVSDEAAGEMDAALDDAWADGRGYAEVNVDGLSDGSDAGLTVGSGLHDQPVTAFARIEIPRYGPQWSYTILSSVSQDALAAGPGWYPETALPGEAGNTALAGHRMGNGAPFTRLSELEVCDEIVLTTADKRLSYRVLPIDGAREDIAECADVDVTEAVVHGELSHLPGRHITTPSDVAVLEPVPYLGLDTVPTRSILTLTTCHPWYDNSERQIVHAVLAKSAPTNMSPD